MPGKDKRLLEKGAADALGEGALRFEKVIENVRRGNAPARDARQAPASNPLLSASPGEEWARQFQTQVIGPETGRLSAVSFAIVPKRFVLPSGEEPVVPRQSQQFAPKLAMDKPDLRFGRPSKPPRRSLLSRLFSRSS